MEDIAAFDEQDARDVGIRMLGTRLVEEAASEPVAPFGCEGGHLMAC